MTRAQEESTASSHVASGRSEPLRRVAVLSTRGFINKRSHCAVHEMEDLLAELEAARILSPEPKAPLGSRLAGLTNQALRRIGWELAPLQRGMTLESSGPVDLLLVHSESFGQLRELSRLVPSWQDLAAVCVCRIEEMWTNWVSARWCRRLLSPFDAISLGCAQSVEPLTKVVDAPVAYHPPAVDVERFTPATRPAPRVIDVLSLGRRPSRPHEALRRYAASHPEFVYLFDTVAGNVGVTGSVEHRDAYADLVRRAQFFIVNPPKFNVTQHTQGQQEVGYRFFEGAAGGAVMLGQAPDCPAFDQYFGWDDAVVSLPAETDDVTELMKRLDGRREELDQVRRRNVVETLRKHDWAHRWRDILTMIDMQPTDALEQRLRRLAELADRHEAGVEALP